MVVGGNGETRKKATIAIAAWPKNEAVRLTVKQLIETRRICPVSDNRLQVTKENELLHIGNEIKEMIFLPFTHRKMTRRVSNLDEIQWNRDSGSRPPESSESCWLLDRQPESSASSG